MAFTLLNSLTGTPTTADSATTPSADTTGATLIVVTMSWNHNLGTAVVTDSKSNTWTQCFTPLGNNPRLGMYYCVSPTVGTGHTFTSTLTGGNSSLQVLTFSGVDTADALEAANVTYVSSGSSTIVTGNITPAANGAMLVFGTTRTTGSVSTVDIGTLEENLSQGTYNFPIATAYLEQTSAAPVQATFTGTGSVRRTAGIVAFNVASGGGAVTGTGDIDAQASQVDGSGVIGRVGTGTLSAQASEVSGTGVVGNAVTGTGTLDSQESSLSGLGVIGRVGSGSLESQSSTVDGTGAVVTVGAVTGTGSIDCQASDVSGAGIIGRKATGALASQTAELSGVGLIGRSGTGAIQCGTATINGIGIVSGNITGTGGIAAQASVIDGTGTVYSPVTITGTGALACGPSSVSGSDDTTRWIEITSVSTTWTEI